MLFIQSTAGAADAQKPGPTAAKNYKSNLKANYSSSTCRDAPYLACFPTSSALSGISRLWSGPWQIAYRVTQC